MKIAVTGKGGVGKSTMVGLMARVLTEAGSKVIVIDADPDMNAGTILGVPQSQTITPIIELKSLIADRTGTEVDKPAPFFKLNPRVDDIPDRYCVEHRGIKLLVMGTVNVGGGGCACPQNAFLKNLLSHLVLYRQEYVVLDMEAGIEHLGRGTASGVDQMIIVVEPSATSIETAFRARELAHEAGIEVLRVIGNKIRTAADRDFVLEKANGFDIIGFVDYSEDMRRVDSREISVLELQGDVVGQVRKVLSDKLLADKGLADKDLADKDLADKDLADKDLADKDLADKDLADKDLADKDVTDEKQTQK